MVEKNEINYLLKKTPYIKDALVEGNKVFFVSDKDVSYDKILNDFGETYDLVRVPNLLHRDLLKKYLFSTEMYKKVVNDFRKNGINNFKIDLTYADMETGFNRRNLKENREQKNTESMSESEAYLYNGPIDWEQMLCTSLPDLLGKRKNSEQKIIYIDQNGEQTQTYAQLYDTVMKKACAMKKAGIKKQDKIIFQMKENRNFIECFWSCMVVGAVVIPVAVLEDYSSQNVNTDKLSKICMTFQDAMILADDRLLEDVNDFVENYGLQCPVYSAEQFSTEEEYIDNTDSLSLEEPCLYLFTSGSTGIPKGVGLTQKNIFARTLGEIQMYGFDSSLSDFNWMTLTHAAGLIWSHIRDVYLDAFQVQTDTDVILRDPLKLLDYMSRFQSTTSWAPNFAYAMVANAIDSSVDYKWNLQSAHNIYTAGETNISKNLRHFLKKTKKYHFPENGLIPSFGMTETSSCITYYNEFSEEHSSDNDTYVPVGTPCRGIEIRIADADNRVLKEGEVGYLQIKGETLLREYYENPEANKKSFSEDGYLITGDLAYIADHNVVITGREKDIIIINGLNYYVQDLEVVADEVPGVRTSDTAVIPVMEDGGESVILFFCPDDEELFEPENINELKTLVKKVKKEIQQKCFITLNHVIPIRQSEFPRTEIGKKQKNPLKKAYEAGVYEELLRTIEERQSLYVLEKRKKELKLNCVGDEWNAVYIRGAAEEDRAHLMTLFKHCYFEQKDFKECDCCVDLTYSHYFNTCELDETNNENLKKLCTDVLQTIEEYSRIQKKLYVVFPVLISKKKPDLTSNMLIALLKTFDLENDLFTFKVVLMEQIDWNLIQQECNSVDKYNVITYTDGIRQIDTYHTYNYVCDRKAIKESLENKIAVLIGGFGGIGQLMCKYLLETYESVKLLVIGRRKEEEVKKYLEQFGTDRVLYGQADILDYEQLHTVCENAKKNFGIPIGCMFDLAARGVSKNEEMTIKEVFNNQKTDIYQESFAVKLIGLNHAEKIRKENDCRMYVYGSVTADFGMVNMSAYAASNFLAEKYCEYKENDQLKFIGFSGWNNIGMNLKKSSDEMKDFLDHFNSDKNGFLRGFTAETGINTVDSILCSEAFMCFAGIDHNFAGIQYCIDDSWKENIQIVVDDKESLEKAKQIINEKYPMIRKSVIYVINPMNQISTDRDIGALEQKIKKIWENVLDCEISDLNDNLFDLGGNSLSVFRLVGEVKDALSIDIKPVDIMTYSTVRSFVSYILENTKKGGQSKKTENNKEQVKRRRLKTDSR